jgi:subtilase family serine protease
MNTIRQNVATITLALALFSPAARADYTGPRVYLSDSIVLPSTSTGAPGTLRVPTAAERGQKMSFSVSLKMRNLDSLNARLAEGQHISQDDMETNYLPALSDYEAMVSWILSQGFTIAQEDSNHTTILATGTIAQLQEAFGVTFAMINTANGELPCGITPPLLPEELARFTLSVSGLQPVFEVQGG